MGRQAKPKAYDIMAPTCPSRVILNRIGARWTIFVVVALAERPKRFGELKTHIRGITSKALTETLRAMARDGLIQRTEYEGQPPAVEYALTALGRSLLVPLAAVRQWAENHVPEVLDANLRADESDFAADVFVDDTISP
ncbi:helix-turn-helix transcriptional regulator [Mycobacterium shinjukuense]|uniref:Transcriptional regulator n=1 Tax=Mycobacterium shinjukuense TaxID=398694 RepID=A0A7I7MRM9_9MYCO|nr:helix-turn-helix domain-containing protein [Mycobacterium shinjukuense]MCV6985557.1 helix-turn-helix transcriptional regulator [Mycobacterium shinjukuense]ORB68173.1 transcriptional regulator [Mycobacterium shinjukuense]BBX74462.1 transcriptional regulator [Mycobacterium shinjukuense]